MDTAEGGKKRIEDGAYTMPARSIAVFESVCNRPAEAGRKNKKGSKKKT